MNDCSNSFCLRQGGWRALAGRILSVAAVLVLTLLSAGNLRAAVRLDVFVGYDGILRQGGFFPVIFEVFNDGPSFNGVLELTPGQFGQGQIRQVPVELPTGTLKRIIVPVFSAQQYGSSSWNVRLIDDRRKVRAETTSRQIRKNNLASIPLLAAITRTAPPLPDVKPNGPDIKLLVARFQPNLFPDNPIALEGIDTLYLSSEKALDLKVNQVNALLAWLYSGGHLVVGIEQVGHLNGAEWLQRILPCDLTELTNVPDHASLQNWLRSDAQLRSGGNEGSRRRQGGGQAGTDENPYANLPEDSHFNGEPLQVATGKLRDGQIMIGSSVPLAITAPRGRGQITVLTFSPELEPFSSWINRAHFWSKMIKLPPELLTRTEYNAYGGYSMDGVFGAIVDSKQVRKLPVGWLLLLLVGYLIVIGPLDRYWLRKIGKQMLTWITFPIYVALFSGLIYFIGYKLRAGETEWNELQIVDIIPVGERADVRGYTYASVYSPVNASYRLASDQPFSTLRGEFMRSAGGQEASKAVVRQQGNSFEAEIAVPVWTSQLYVNEWWRQGPSLLQCSVTSKGADWEVAVDNRFDFKLSNLMLVLEDRVFNLGEIPRSQNKTFTFSKQSGEMLPGFVQNHSANFPQLVSQRQNAFGYREQISITDIPRSLVAASFISRNQANLNNRQQNYGYNTAITPPGFELSKLVERGDAVLFAWAPGSTVTKPLNQFSARRGERDSLFRLAVPVQH